MPTNRHALCTPAGRWRLARLEVLAGFLAVVLVGTACAKATSPPSGLITSSPAPGHRQTSTSPTIPTPTSSPPPPRPPALVAVTTAGEVEMLDPRNGHLVTALASGATGDEVSLNADRSRVYFETSAGCSHQIMSVPTGGGAASLVAVAGSHPAVSPDGTKLAYAVEPLGNGCPNVPNTANEYSVVVKPLGGGALTAFLLPPSLVSAAQVRTVGHLSWAPDNRRLVVSIEGGSDNKRWSANVVDTAADRYYVPAAGSGVPVQGPAGSYYREAVFAPDGNLFANVVCCASARTPTATLLAEVDLAGNTVQQISSGLTDRDHTSLDADAGGHWVLYLAGSDLVVSGDAAAPTVLSTAGFAAADW